MMYARNLDFVTGRSVVAPASWPVEAKTRAKIPVVRGNPTVKCLILLDIGGPAVSGRNVIPSRQQRASHIPAVSPAFVPWNRTPYINRAWEIPA
jgi:hypothetical protein